MSRSPRQRQGGFTLFELIIAMALSAVLALIGAAALSAGADFYGRAHRVMKEHESFRATERIVRHEWQGRGAKIQATTQGTQLSFETSQVAFLQEVRGVSFVRYRCEAQGDAGFRLLHEAFQRPMNLSAGGVSGAESAAPPPPKLLLQEVLLERLAQCEFSLLGAVQGADGKATPAWLTQWEDTTVAPLLLRLKAVGQRGELPPWLFVARKRPT